MEKRSQKAYQTKGTNVRNGASFNAHTVVPAETSPSTTTKNVSIVDRQRENSNLL